MTQEKLKSAEEELNSLLEIFFLIHTIHRSCFASYTVNQILEKLDLLFLKELVLTKNTKWLVMHTFQVGVEAQDKFLPALHNSDFYPPIQFEEKIALKAFHLV